ncbi:MAG TPA: DUF2934 domain-containing protein [Thermoanaerobaculia bacterium]|nr:DUF2934 domain-containing protein [Thermoanaerobaculia bacterium]
MDNNSDSRPKTRKTKTATQGSVPSASRRSGARASAPAAPTNASGDIRRVTPEEIHHLIAEAAYYRAQQRGFAPGDPLQDWLEAEAEVMVRVRNSAPIG